MLRKNVFMLGFCLITSSFVLAKIFYSDLSIVGKQGEIIGFLIKDPPDSNDLSIDDSTGTEGEWVPDDSTGNNGDKLLGVINNSNGLNFGFSIFPNPASNEIN
ncbi:MAG: hypothetical protein ACK444_07095, partial [Flavobacteriales bacterium]